MWSVYLTQNGVWLVGRWCCAIWKHHRRVHLRGDAHASRCQRPPDSRGPSSRRQPNFPFPQRFSGARSETGAGKRRGSRASRRPADSHQRRTTHRSRDLRDLRDLHHWRSDSSTGVCGEWNYLKHHCTHFKEPCYTFCISVYFYIMFLCQKHISIQNVEVSLAHQSCIY